MPTHLLYPIPSHLKWNELAEPLTRLNGILKKWGSEAVLLTQKSKPPMIQIRIPEKGVFPAAKSRHGILTGHLFDDTPEALNHWLYGDKFSPPGFAIIAAQNTGLISNHLPPGAQLVTLDDKTGPRRNTGNGKVRRSVPGGNGARVIL